MDVVELIPGLHFLRFPIGHAYLLEHAGGLALIDTSVPGSAPRLAAAIRDTGRDPADLRHLVLTHFHGDHAGSAADVAAWGDVEVVAHHADAPFLRGDGPGPPPQLADWERPIFDQVTARLPAAPVPPVR
ncbi:MAG TPA: MBL fold metallo-hydrolase, partial [Streptosporangiaceae bacterium]|nr:MBL fold metallo-hydrolase [Streptosporangiaceae bacterium]